MAGGAVSAAAQPDEKIVRETVGRALHGERDAWEDLYLRLRPRLFAICLRKLGNREDAEDAVAETMLRAVRAAKTFRWKDAGFDAWIFRICRDVVIDMQRSRSRGAALRSGDGPADVGTAEERIVLADEYAAVRRALDRLPADDRELLELRIIGELSSEEVAYVLGKRPGAIRTAQSRALARMRTYLAEEAR
jgi:RNA polymerase sigma-70 factor (ECF subfamily)